MLLLAGRELRGKDDVGRPYLPPPPGGPLSHDLNKCGVSHGEAPKARDKAHATVSNPASISSEGTEVQMSQSGEKHQHV